MKQERQNSVFGNISKVTPLLGALVHWFSVLGSFGGRIGEQVSQDLASLPFGEQVGKPGSH